MKIVLVIIICSFLSSCGWAERVVATVGGGGNETCHDGVSYVQFTSGASVKYTRDGKIATCGD